MSESKTRAANALEQRADDAESIQQFKDSILKEFMPILESICLFVRRVMTKLEHKGGGAMNKLPQIIIDDTLEVELIPTIERVYDYSNKSWFNKLRGFTIECAGTYGSVSSRCNLIIPSLPFESDVFIDAVRIDGSGTRTTFITSNEPIKLPPKWEAFLAR